ncbi:MAG: DUF2207 domain-containing protein [Firmicutes bacterium]|nr:DUF2207 domain-containing protein [Bacillota bacterium]
MKKILLFIFMFLFSISVVEAKNHIYNIDMDIYIDENGNANIEEIWTVKGSDGTEWYKGLGDLGNSEISNFTVSMDGNELTYKSFWNINDSLEKKKGYYGINYSTTGPELCFGKYDFKKHEFKLNYTLSNFIFNVEDAQAIYFTFIDRLSSVDFESFDLEISTYYDIPDTLDVWGYGYKGYAYVEDGKIKMTNDGDMNGNYVVLLAKFPLNTFNTDNSYSQFETFEDIYNLAEEGTFDYEYYYDSESSTIGSILSSILSISMWFLFVVGITSAVNSSKYGYIDDKTITKKNTPLFRDIPCNKDIYYASALANLNKFSKETNILGAIFLSWIKQGIVVIQKDSKGNSNLILQNKSKITNELEMKLYDIVFEASKDGILEKKELEKWARRNYDKYLDLFTRINDFYINKLKSDGHIFKRTDKKQCKFKNVMDDTLYEESKKLYGLKLFLDEFSNMKDKEAIEVTLWNEYLMFAYIFGNAKKVMDQFKDLYPEIIAEMENYNMDFDTLIFLNTISYSSATAATSARSAAQSYSSGGGGFSSGGGGGGSFGGGGGGGSR